MTFIIDLSVPGAVAHGRMPGGHLIGARARGGFGVRSLEPQPPRPNPPASPADTVQRVLALARTYLRMDVAWLAELRGDEQVLTHVEASDATDVPPVRSATAIPDAFYGLLREGRLPAVIADD